MSNKVTLNLTVNDSSLPQPPPTSPPTFSEDLAMSPDDVKKTVVVNGQTIVATTNTQPTFVGVTAPGVTLTVHELDSSGNSYGSTFTTTSDPTTGAFSFPFQNPSGTLGTFEIYVVAQYTQYPGVGSTESNHVTFQIVTNAVPGPVTDFRLSPASDTGIAGDNVTNDRLPAFIGTTAPGNTVELFVNGQTAAQATTTASSTTSTDANGATYNFSIQLPFALTNGQTSVYVKVINLAGNASVASSTVGISVVSTPADYNGGKVSDPAVFNRLSSSNQVQWLVQTPTGTAPPWFGPSGTPYIPSVGFTGVLTVGSAVLSGVSSTSGLAVGDNITGTGIPAGTTIVAINSSTSITLSAAASGSGSTQMTATVPSNHVVPFQGDFDGDGIADLAYYNLATATWTIFESSTTAVQGATTFAMGTPNLSLPVVGHFDANGPTEVGVLTVVQGQDIFTIASASFGHPQRQLRRGDGG